MKIVHLLLGIPDPETLCGVNRVVHHLASEQLAAGYQVEVWGICPSGAGAAYRHDYPLRIFLQQKGRFLLDSALRASLSDLDSSDWVQMHSVFIPEFVAVAKRLRRQGVPYGITPHGAYAQGCLGKNRLAKAIFFLLFEAAMLRGARLLHLLGEGELEDLKRLLPGCKAAIVPNGQDLSFLGRVDMLRIEHARPVFGFCGRLSARHKGLDLLIEGFSRYCDSGGEGTLWLVGDGEDRTLLENAVRRKGLEGRVVFHGARFGDEKWQLLGNMDVFLHPSRWEGMPTGCLEAAALKRPLLISRETNLAPAVASWGSGWVLEDNTPTHLARLLGLCEGAYREGTLTNRGESAYRMVEEGFRWRESALDLARKWVGEP